MPQRTVANITLADADDDGIALDQKPLSGGNLTLNGALVSGGVYTASDAPHKLVFTTAADESKKTFTITGTDGDGIAQTETVTGPNATTGNSTKFYKTVTSIVVSAALSDNVKVGTVNSVQTGTIKINTRTSAFNVANAMIISGTIDYTLSHTYDNIMKTANNECGNVPVITASYINDATIAAKTASFASALALPVNASKLTVNSYSSGATIRWNIVEVYEN